ncbi:uncharacterized protein [Arachis hypogaea]|uniref:uncharacterized protein n=1 Tax=Arachis hypogaea TaxID=3818 RepID=UPI000DEC9CD6|nr:uncharacterized protein LOC112742180 [Arachis hypogaea]
MTFQASDFNTATTNLDDHVVISIQLGDLLVKKVLLDPGSSADVLFYPTFQKMKLSNNLPPDLGERVPVLGSAWLQTTLGDDGTIATIHSDNRDARQCYNNSLKRRNRNINAHVHTISNQDESPVLADLDLKANVLERPTPTEDLHKTFFADNSEKFTYVGFTLSLEEKTSFQKFLQQNADLFAWTPADMPSIDPSVVSHKLALNPSVRPIAQKKKNLGLERKQAFLEETKKLINAGFIQEIRFTTWLANVVMILMHPSDQSKTAFITEFGNYCYKVMPFGLKNAGAIYQHLMDKVFAAQISRNLEVYVDDMVAKTKLGHNHLDNLAEIFKQIRKYNTRLNLKNCAFGVQGGKFLAFMLTNRGIENGKSSSCRSISSARPYKMPNFAIRRSKSWL